MSAALLALALLASPPDDEAAKKALEIFKSTIRNPDEAARAAAVEELAKVPHKRTLPQVGARLMTDGKKVRLAAAKGLAAFTDHKKRVIPMLAKGLTVNKKEPDVQVAILETLGALKDEAGLAIVHGQFDVKDPNVCVAAFKAAGLIASVRSVDPIMKEYRKLDAALQQGAINTGGLVPGTGGSYNIPTDANSRRRAQLAVPAATGALEQITKQKFKTFKEADTWWRANRGSFRK